MRLLAIIFHPQSASLGLAKDASNKLFYIYNDNVICNNNIINNIE